MCGSARFNSVRAGFPLLPVRAGGERSRPGVLVSHVGAVPAK
jgi:hypothetical protein